MHESFRVRARSAEFSFGADRINLFSFWYKGDGNYKAKQLEFVSAEPFEPLEPFVTIDKEQAQILMDDLWNTGLRPSEGTGSAGQLAATQKHLADMKVIAFHKLGIKE